MTCHFKMHRENFRKICDLTESVLNLDNGILKTKSRKRPLQVARQVAAIIGRQQEGIHRKIVGSVLNRDRTLIYHYEKTHDSNFKYCKIYEDAYTKVYNAYKNLNSDKKVFVKGSDLHEFLIKNGVVEAPLYMEDIIIAVQSGDASCLIKTTYIQFSKQIEIIKSLLVNYHYTINII
tara:strand:- start:1415 stop:1945 length:531 start_codon:yes stop_codon:yes gene_type:complete